MRGARKKSTHRNKTALHQIQDTSPLIGVLRELGIEKGNQWDGGEESPAHAVIAKETWVVSENMKEEEGSPESCHPGGSRRTPPTPSWGVSAHFRVTFRVVGETRGPDPPLTLPRSWKQPEQSVADGPGALS